MPSSRLKRSKIPMATESLVMLDATSFVSIKSLSLASGNQKKLQKNQKLSKLKLKLKLKSLETQSEIRVNEKSF